MNQNSCHVLDHIFCLCLVLLFSTVLWSFVQKRNVNFLLTATVFREVVSGGEAQWTLRVTWCSRCREKAVLFFICLSPCQVHFAQETWVITTIIAIGLASNEGQKTSSLSSLAIFQADVRLQNLPSKCVIPAKNIFICRENSCPASVLNVLFVFCSAFWHCPGIVGMEMQC